jgi:aldehyde dehydrogenase (NAD+)
MTAHNATLTPNATDVQDLMREVGVAEAALNAGGFLVRSPINGAAIAEVKLHSLADANCAIHAADVAFQIWRTVPAPKRGELVRLFAEELRARKAALGRLVAIETGKILREGLGEVRK